jgi:hypothetical protein
MAPSCASLFRHFVGALLLTCCPPDLEDKGTPLAKPQRGDINMIPPIVGRGTAPGKPQRGDINIARGNAPGRTPTATPLALGSLKTLGYLIQDNRM